MNKYNTIMNKLSHFITLIRELLIRRKYELHSIQYDSNIFTLKIHNNKHYVIEIGDNTYNYYIIMIDKSGEKHIAPKKTTFSLSNIIKDIEFERKIYWTQD